MFLDSRMKWFNLRNGGQNYLVTNSGRDYMVLKSVKCLLSQIGSQSGNGRRAGSKPCGFLLGKIRGGNTLLLGIV